MGKLRVLGVIILVYAVVCVYGNWLSLFLGLPSLGDAGGWVFNPFGMLLSAPISNYLIEQLGTGAWLFGDFFRNGAAWAVGGGIAILWALFMFLLGWKLFRH